MTLAMMLSTECVNEWCQECKVAACMCDCHIGPVPVKREPRPKPRGGNSSRERVYEALVGYHAAHGHAPTVRQIGTAIGLSPTTVQYHIGQLVKFGRISKSGGCPRTATPAAAVRS